MKCQGKHRRTNTFPACATPLYIYIYIYIWKITRANESTLSLTSVPSRQGFSRLSLGLRGFVIRRLKTKKAHHDLFVAHHVMFVCLFFLFFFCLFFVLYALMRVTSHALVATSEKILQCHMRRRNTTLVYKACNVPMMSLLTRIASQLVNNGNVALCFVFLHHVDVHRRK